MTKAISLKQALATLSRNVKMSPVDTFINFVNSCFADKETMSRHRCDLKVGHFYQMGMNLLEVSKEECLEIEKAFRKQGWKDVQVVYWLGAVSISLEAASFRGWKTAYNGEYIGVAGDAPVEKRRNKEPFAAVFV